ncbi:chromosome segregation smc-like [Trichoderma cornu-damae]|uniref:Chromosome segregation smc-like n=1 Tax=Trichoderma cornu-damae TaxID=654480 RepID=A0A9P8QWZ2_9HYPO|nr:chromosome segregation smc-like [Trichoderma cornu-damae]
MIWRETRALTIENGFNTLDSSTGSTNSAIQGVSTVIGNMLSVNFSTPLTGTARSERIKQMSNNHPAFEKSRITQEILVKIQHSLRRMPGVSANESAEIIQSLIEVGQVISRETSALVEAVMNLHLDQEDTDKAIARMSIEANLAKANADDQAQKISSLQEELALEKDKRELSESGFKNMMETIADITTEFKQLRDKADKQKTDSLNNNLPSLDGDFLVKSLDNTIQILEDQANKHRTLWVVRQPNPEAVTRAIEPTAETAQDRNGYHRPLVPLQEETQGDGSVFNDALPPPRAASAFQPVHRPPTAGPPPKFGQFQGMPSRPPTALPHERRSANAWNLVAPIHGGRPGPFNNKPQYPGPPFGRAPSRQGYQSNPRFRPDNFPQSAFAMPENPPPRPSSAFGYGRDYFPHTPTGPGRRYGGRLRDTAPPPPSLDFGASSSNGSTPGPPSTHVNRSPYSGSSQPITITEQTVQAWHGYMMHFYATIRNFVEHHANNPDLTGETKLSQTHLWPILLATYYPLSEQEAESYLEFHVRSENSKSCIVTRVIIDFVVNRVWNPSAWSGADADSTFGIMEPILDRLASIVGTVIKNEQGGPFVKNRIEEATHTLLASLQPLMNKFYNSTEAFRDLEQVIDSAYEISCKILTSRLTFDFRFPEIGSRFSSQSMLPIWPNTDPLELQAKHWRVALVTTPVVTCRNDTGSNISAHSVSLADVFCMQ